MIDLLSLSIAIGLVVSLLFSETLGRGAGGLVVPGYVALYLTRPADVVLTLLVALATWAIVHWLAQWLIVYGRRRTVLMLLVGFLLGMAVRSGMGLALTDPTTEYTVIGYIIPALLAIWFDRQGLFDTCVSTLTASAVVRLALVLLAPAMLQNAELDRAQRQREAQASGSFQPTLTSPAHAAEGAANEPPVGPSLRD